MQTSRFVLALAAASCCAPAFAEDPVNIGDVVLGLSASVANQAGCVRQVRGGIQDRDIRLTAGGAPDPFPGTGTGQRGAWTTTAFLQSAEFDNANGFSHNARGNLMMLNFGSAGTGAANGGQLFGVSTNGSNTVSPVLFQFNAANTGEATGQRTGGLSISPDNTHLAGGFFESGRVFLLTYDQGMAVGTGGGMSVSNFSKSAPINTISHTWGTTFLDNSTIIIVYTNISVTTVATIAFNPATNVFAAPVTRVQIQPFDNSGNSRVTDVEYNTLISPYVYVFYSLFSGATTNKLSVIDPATWTLLKTIDLSASVGTSRECAFGPDKQLYISEFCNDSQNVTYVDVIKLDVDGNGTISLADTMALTNNSASNHSSRLPFPLTTPLDLGASFAGLDIALTGPSGTPSQPVTGACCLSGSGCLAAITTAACTSAAAPTRATTRRARVARSAPARAATPPTARARRLTSPPASARAVCTTERAASARPRRAKAPAACCKPDGSCVLGSTRDCFYNQIGYFKGIGSACTVTCTVPPPVQTTYTFDSTNPFPDGRNLSFVAVPDLSGSTPPGTFSDVNGQPYTNSTFDVFGVVDRSVNTDFADDSNGILPQDTFGVIYTGKTDKFFGVEDLLNTDDGGTGTGTGTAVWTFDISNLTGLAFQVDVVSLGNFEDTAIAPGSIADTFNFTYSIDGGAAQPLFTSDILEGSLTYGIMEQGSRISYIGGEGLQDPVSYNGIQIRNDFIRLLNSITGTGSVLTITFTATNDGNQEVFAFDNLTIRGTAVPQNGACCRGDTCVSSSQTACTGPNSQYRGNGTMCNVPGNNITPCCKADYNHVGGVTVQDIFDFLAGYFSGSPDADFNGGGVSVQDIFDYLAAYFAGC